MTDIRKSFAAIKKSAEIIRKKRGELQKVLCASGDKRFADRRIDDRQRIADMREAARSKTSDDYMIGFTMGQQAGSSQRTGYLNGNNEGYDRGYTEGYDKGFEDGRKGRNRKELK